METLRDLDLVRDTIARAEVRADDTDSPLMVLRFSVFDSWYEIDSFFEGTFLERTSRGAFTKTMRESGSRVLTLFNHGMDAQVGDQIIGEVTDLREDPDAAVLEARLLDGVPPLIVSGLRASLYGSSFMFRVVIDEWNDEPGTSAYNPKGLPERTIKEVRLYEAGPVTWPANPAATAGIRSATDSYYQALRSRDPRRVDTLQARALKIRTPNEEAVRQLVEAGANPERVADTLTDGAAADLPDAPDSTEHHAAGLTPSQRRMRLYPYLEEAS